MTLKQIQYLVERSLDIQIDVKGREGKRIEAKRLAIWIARREGFVYRLIGESWGINHDTAIHHQKKMQGLIEVQDKETLQLIYRATGLDMTHKNIYSPRLSEEDKDLLEMYRGVLSDVPIGKEYEVRDRIKLFIRGLNIKPENKQAEVILSNCINIE